MVTPTDRLLEETLPQLCRGAAILGAQGRLTPEKRRLVQRVIRAAQIALDLDSRHMLTAARARALHSEIETATAALLRDAPTSPKV